MRIGLYTCEQRPAPGWQPPRILPRLSQTATMGGGRVTVMAGHISDEVTRLRWDLLDASPAVLQLDSYPDTDVVADTITAGQRLAFKASYAAAFAAISAAHLRLRQNGNAAGDMSIEIWRAHPTTGLPDKRVGLLAVVKATDLTTSWAGVDRFAGAAWPLPASPGWVVLNGATLTAGTISWAGETAATNAHAKYSGGSWSFANGELSGAAWQGGQYLVLRGLVEAEDGAGPAYQIDLGDGQIYTARLADLRGNTGLWAASINASAIARDVELVMQLEAMR